MYAKTIRRPPWSRLGQQRRLPALPATHHQHCEGIRGGARQRGDPRQIVMATKGVDDRLYVQERDFAMYARFRIAKIKPGY